MKKSKQEQVVEAVNFFLDNPSLRSIKEGEDGDRFCCYSSKYSGKEGSKGCMVGYFLEEDFAKFLDKTRMNTNLTQLLINNVPGRALDDNQKDKFPTLITENISLFHSLQAWHDMDSYWEEDKLTSIGRNELLRIFKEHELDVKNLNL